MSDSGTPRIRHITRWANGTANPLTRSAGAGPSASSQAWCLASSSTTGRNARTRRAVNARATAARRLLCSGASVVASGSESVDRANNVPAV
jgi:hypothetical protein